jgi:hypothetical protein
MSASAERLAACVETDNGPIGPGIVGPPQDPQTADTEEKVA